MGVLVRKRPTEGETRPRSQTVSRKNDRTWREALWAAGELGREGSNSDLLAIIKCTVEFQVKVRACLWGERGHMP